jgi:hypothetical protein
VPGDVGVGEFVPEDGAVALAVGQMFEDRRHRACFGIGRHPDARGQAAAIRRDDADIRRFDDLTGKACDDFHSIALASLPI